MALNIYLLARELRDLNPFVHAVTSPKDTGLSYCVPLQKGERPKPGAVSVVGAASLEALPSPLDAGVVLAVAGAADRQLFPAGGDVVVVPEVDVLFLLGRILEVFERYRRWEDDMRAAVQDNAPLKTLGELSQPFICNPIHLSRAGFQNVFHVVDHLRNADPARCVDYCKDFSDDGHPLEEGEYPPLETLSQMISDRAYPETLIADDPVFFPGVQFGYRSLLYNIKSRGDTVAQLCIDGVEHDFEEADIALITIVGGYVGKAVARRQFDRFDRPRDLEKVLQSLFDHILVDEKKIIGALGSYGWKQTDRFICLVAQSLSYDKSNHTLAALAGKMVEWFPAECHIVRDNYLLFVVNLTRSALEVTDLLRLVAPLLRDELLVTGVSNTYDDFKESYSFARQARRALELGREKEPEGWLFRYGAFQLADCLDRCRSNLAACALCPEWLNALFDYDEANGTEYVAFLRCYLKHSMNIAETARELFLHRNTCVYRIKRIHEITQQDFTDSDARFAAELGLRLRGEE